MSRYEGPYPEEFKKFEQLSKLAARKNNATAINKLNHAKDTIFRYNRYNPITQIRINKMLSEAERQLTSPVVSPPFSPPFSRPFPPPFSPPFSPPFPPSFPPATGINNDVCPICQLNNIDLIQLPCGHKFHQSCINLWLPNHNTCPVCRASVLGREYGKRKIGRKSRKIGGRSRKIGRKIGGRSRKSNNRRYKSRA
jgi:hypothetical protein